MNHTDNNTESPVSKGSDEPTEPSGGEVAVMTIKLLLGGCVVGVAIYLIDRYVN